MAIIFPLSPPDETRVQYLRISRSAAVGVSVSPFTMQQQVYEHQGQMWSLEFSLPPMRWNEADAWIAWLLALNGRAGTFLMGDSSRASPRGSALGSPVVDGAGQSGSVLLTRGWTALQAGVLRAGDYLQLGTGSNTRLHAVLATADADASGEAALDIWPRLRTSPGDGEAIVVTHARGRWRLSSNEAGWQHDPGRITRGITIAATEAL